LGVLEVAYNSALSSGILILGESAVFLSLGQFYLDIFFGSLPIQTLVAAWCHWSPKMAGGFDWHLTISLSCGRIFFTHPSNELNAP